MEATRVERTVRARLSRWPYEPDVAHLVLLDHKMVPTGSNVSGWIDEARRSGCTVIRTGALFPNSIEPFVDAGFHVIDRLALLEMRLHAHGGRQGAMAERNRTRALRARRLGDAAAIDRRAFTAPWGNDRDALADILHATPACRARSISIDRSMAAFAISGVADRVGYLQRLAVDPTAQRRGLGGALVTDSLEWMRHRGANTAMVNTGFDNIGALTLYEAAGFRRRDDSLSILELRLGPLRVMARGRAISTALAIMVAVIAAAAGWNVEAASPHSPAHTSLAQTPAQTPAPVTAGVVKIELIEEQFAFGPDESLHLVYRLTGDLAALELAPVPAITVPATTVPATIPPSTTPSTTTSATTPATAVNSVAPDLATATPPTDAPETVPATTVPPPPPIPLTIEVTNYPPLASAGDIEELVGGDVDRDAFGPGAIDGVQIADARPSIVIADDGTATLTLDIPTDVDNSVEEQLKFDRPGLYPIRTELLAGGLPGEMIIATHGTIVQRLPGTDEPSTVAPPINLTVVAAISPAAADTTVADEQAKAADFDDAVTMAGIITSPATLQIPPPIVAAEAGSPEGSARLESSLEGDKFVALPAVPLDVSSAAAAGKSDEFARQLGLGEDMLTEAVPTTPSTRSVWIATEPLSGAGAQELRDLGFRYLVMADEMYRTTVDPEPPATDLFVEALLPGGGTLPLIVVDPLSEQLTATAADDILATATTTEWAVRTVSKMLVEQADDQPRLDRSRVLSTPDLRAPDTRLLLGLEALVATTPSVEFAPASTLTGRTDVQSQSGEPVQVELPSTAGPSLTERIAILGSTALSAASAGSMLPADDPRPAAWAADLEAMVSTAVSDDEVAATTARIQSETDAIRDAVVAPDPFSFTLTGRSGDIELQLANTSPDPLTVILRSSSQKLSFPDSTEPAVGPPDANAGDHEITLRPNDETAVVIPVRAKSNGTSPITVQLLTPAGELIGDPVTITATVTAFTGLGQVLTAGLVLVLLTWWVTHWRSRRRAALTDVRERHPSGAQ